MRQTSRLRADLIARGHAARQLLAKVDLNGIGELADTCAAEEAEAWG